MMATKPLPTLSVNSETPGDAWRNVFGLDTRSLSLFRIGLGILLIADVFLRWPDVLTLYTDDGFFTRAIARDFFDKYQGLAWEQGTWSVHFWSGTAQWIYALLVAQAICGAGLIAGTATRACTIIGWILIASLQIRNPIIITSGDFILKLMLFWGIFLPLNRHWSLDAWWVRRRGRQWRAGVAANGGTVGFVWQLIFIYFFTGIAKWNEEWLTGVAMEKVLNLDIYLRPLAYELAPYKSFLKWVSWSTVGIEVIGIWLLLLPWRNAWWRIGLTLAYWLFHLGIATTMDIGLFPYICLVLWLPLLPTQLWQVLNTDATAANKDGANSQVGTLPAVINGFCYLMAGVMLLHNLVNINELGLQGRIPGPLCWLSRVTASTQHFQMFGRPPLSVWFVYEARLQNGTRLDLMHPTLPLSNEKPPSVKDYFTSHNWRKLHRNLADPEFASFRQPLLDYQVAVWNRRESPERQIVTAALKCFVFDVRPGQDAKAITAVNLATWNRGPESAGSLFDGFLQDMEEGKSQFPFHP